MLLNCRFGILAGKIGLYMFVLFIIKVQWVVSLYLILQIEKVSIISLDGLLSCAVKPPDHYCTACWNGKYRIPVDIALNKFAMEHYQMFMFDEIE